ncbi:MAG: DUF2277 domain-containing protein [Sandaracinaceae bacterium]
MCRNIKLLYHFEPPATEAEIRASALQYVRKVTGMTKPSQANEAAFQRAVDEITALTTRLLLEELETAAPPRDREAEKRRAKERGEKREAQLRARYGAE